MDALHEDTFGKGLVDCDELVNKYYTPTPIFSSCGNCANLNRQCVACKMKALLCTRHYEGETLEASQLATEPIAPSPELQSSEVYDASNRPCHELLESDNLGIELTDGDEVTESDADFSSYGPPEGLIYFDKPRPSHLIQILKSLGGRKSKPHSLQYLFRLGTARTVYKSSHQRGTAHALGIWSTSHLSSIEDVLGDWFQFIISLIRRDGILKTCYNALTSTQLSSPDVD